MRIACTIGCDVKGKWHTLALPDVDPRQQRELLKDLEVNNGVYGTGKDAVQLVGAHVLTERGTGSKRAKFKPVAAPAKKAAPKK